MPLSMRSSFNSSGLVRLLADLNIAEPGNSKQTFAERLSQWMGWTDAISLSAALGGNAAPKAMNTSTSAPGNARTSLAVRAVIKEFTRVRAELARSITSDAAFSDGAGFERDGTPWRQAYQARQRAMETRIGALRAEVRAALSGHSRELARLAALDAVLDRAMAPRERQLLSTVPGLLEQHAERTRKELGTAAGAAPAFDRRSLQALLLAELDIRLQPTEGMLEALDRQAPGLT